MYLPSFPPEIWKEILENATTQDLKNISLASPTLCKFSQKRLFSAIVVKGDTRRLEARWKLFTRTVEHSPRLAREVRTIHLSLLDSWNAASILEEFLTHVLPLLPALTKLIVQCSFDFDDIISRHRHLFESAQFSSVLTIHLSNVTNFPLRFLVPFKNLETLVLNEAQFSSETDLPHSLVTLPETLVLIPTRFRELSRFFLFDTGKPNGQARRVDVSRLRNIFLEFPFDFENSPGVLRPIQAVLHAASQHLECLEIFLDPAASFCASSESRCLRFANLQRLSFIAQVSQEDMLRGTESDAHAALTSVVDWIKAVDAREHPQEFHLSPRFRFDGKEAENDQRQMIELSIMPALLDIQAFFNQDKHRIPPRVKISVNCAREEDLAPIRAGLAELETSGLEVNNIGEFLSHSVSY
ncbi:hypothetical protein BKA70DRAFT_683124 [Coprinopsis sp. MPI-PUGE-AT-0042]|nr:hypothetical protein BKA70DRAFT_683124 [Coprinopsis sp. MPI-PUGE-AT-0042]